HKSPGPACQPLWQKFANQKKVPTVRQVRTVGTQPGKFGTESVRGRQAECAVLRQILSPGAAAATASSGRSRELPLAQRSVFCKRPLRRAEKRLSAREIRGRNFCRANARRNGSPLKRVARHAF